MRTAIIGAVLLCAGIIAAITGILPWPATVELIDRVLPILVFVVAITVVAELAAAAGVFTFVAERLTVWAGGRTWLLWLLVVVLAVLSTVFLSLDTTAVLLTPVVVVMARHVGLSPLPFALTTVWLANTASLLLPVSNLTNLLAQGRLGDLLGHPVSPIQFAWLTGAPALTAILVTVVAIYLVCRRPLRMGYQVAPTTRVANPVLFGTSAVTVVALIPALVSGVPVWIPAVQAALILTVIFFVLDRKTLSLGLVPWPLVLLASGLFLVMAALHELGLGELLDAAAGSGDDPLSLLRLAGAGMVGANAFDNLPAYLALEPVANSPARLVALLIGVNAGPLITPWASLATLLWHQRLSSLGVEISWRRYMLLGLVVAPATVLIATLVLSQTI
ncbi:ArsB/NhaD family transporter [Cryobacterium sp. SO2]|uniref:SLC13 family permease n=1 Tax=Cryobacterium sp. SO2 TaxID=1897060 RepID=UPI00223D7AC0|nr:SLC13 family permease [Cryobacterium sp. SO2]WEO76114.1 ArsB/NhaD family transporter [Cryobacterium sp. SO2]